jgi:VWFA-related protein
MRTIPRSLAVLTMLASACIPAAAVTVRVENPTGNITVRVVDREKPHLRRTAPDRDLRPDDTSIVIQADLVIIRAQPADKARIDLELDLPYTFDLQALTKDGAITYTGFLRRVDLLTETGEVFIATPWSASRLSVLSREKPGEFTSAEGFEFKQSEVSGTDSKIHWELRDRLPDLRITYSSIAVNALSPRSLSLEDIPIPFESPVKLPWQAPEILEDIVSGERDSKRSRDRRSADTDPKPPAGAEAITVEGGIPTFSSDVRMVNLTAAVFDREGHPLTDLKTEDFEVIENGAPQKVNFAGSEEVPFNLVLFLDLSGSTRRDRSAMKEAAKQFVRIARPQDRVALYALANDKFQVVSRLTDDRERLIEAIEIIPEVSGGSPLYDLMVLSYAEELRQRPGERNAIIVISDGIDNRIYGTGSASDVSFKQLRNATSAMSVLIYPIFLDPFTAIPPPGWAKRAKSNMQELADATGGRLFVAQSIRDLEPVYPLVAEELRSVYTVAYYPENQNFDGSWREVQVKANRPESVVRTRSGYFGK